MSRRAPVPIHLFLGLGLGLGLGPAAALADFGGSRPVSQPLRPTTPQSMPAEVGSAVALTPEIAAVGAPVGELVGNPTTGVVLTYRTNPGVGTLEPLDPLAGVTSGDRLGAQLALSGELLAVSATVPGQVYVLRNLAASWEVEGTIALGIPRFGQALALSADTLYVGAPDPNALGSIHAFSPVDGTWSLRASASAGENGGMFGATLALGPTALAIGAPLQLQRGAVHLATPTPPGDPTLPVDPTFITPPPAESGIRAFGAALAWGPGELLAIGAPESDNKVGAVLVYRREGTDWILQATHRPTPSERPESTPGFGSALAFVEGALAVGAPGEGSGVVYVINAPALPDGGTPGPRIRDPGLLPGSGLGSALASAGRNLLVGAPALMTGRDGQAAVYELLYAQGSPCTSDFDCVFWCADGVCCNRACTAPCERCAIAAGGEIDGVCGPLLCPEDEVCAPQEDLCVADDGDPSGEDSADSVESSSDSPSPPGLGVDPWDSGCGCVSGPAAPGAPVVAVLTVALLGLGRRRQT